MTTDFQVSCELDLEVIGVALVKHRDLVYLSLVVYLSTNDSPDPWCFLALSQLDWYSIGTLLLLFFSLIWIIYLADIKWVRDSLPINIFLGIILDSLFYGCSSLEKLYSQGFDSFLSWRAF